MGSSCCILASASTSTSTAESSPTIASPSNAEVGSSYCNDPCSSTAALGASPSSDASSSTAASASSAAVGASCSTDPWASTAASASTVASSTAEVGASSTAASSTAASSSTAEVGASASTAASSTAPSASTAAVGASYYTDPGASTASTSSAASSSTAASASSAAVGASSSTDPCASTPVMGASPSTVASASTASQSYDFFINHRGVDVKRTFARSLYLRLQEKGLKAFLDQPEMQSGYNFPEQIQNVIETASVHVAIFSPKYADSCWCLDELVMMLHSKAPIIPVFYRVTPADVRHAKGKYAEDLQKLAKKNDKGMPRHDSSTIEKWRNALSTVADYSGLELQKDCNGDELVLELLDR